MQSDTRITTLLVDDHPIVRDGIKARLAAHPQIEIVGEASSGQEAVRKAVALSPRVVVMDIGMPGISGLEATRQITQEVPQAAVLILTVHSTREYAVQALHAGARGYLLKTAPSAQLVAAVEAVSRGEAWFTEDVPRLLLHEQLTAPHGPSGQRLSVRETEVLKLLAEGHTNKEIADRLSLSVRTVETHREHIMQKLDIHTVAGLTRYAISAGITTLQ